MISYLPAAFSLETGAADLPCDRRRDRPNESIGSDLASRVQSRFEEIESLGRSCAEGDTMAWDALFSPAWPVLVTFVHRLYRSLDEQDAEDIAQATLEAAISGISTFSGKGSFRGWLFGIAVRQSATFYRMRSARKRGAGLLVSLEDCIDSEDDARSPVEISAARDRAEILHWALDELEETDRDLVHLYFFGELTFREIAAVRKMNPKTVCTRLTRCKAKLLVILTRLNLTNTDG